MKKRILSCLLSIAMCLTLLPLGIQAQATYFGDVTSHWARSYIEDAVDMGLFNGTAPNRFEPESAMTRAMFVTVLYRMDGGEAERSANFIDVPHGSWYSDAVAWASENSIVTGTSAIRFSPNDSVTREQMVTILNRYLTASGAALGSDGKAPAISFRDSSSIAPYAREAVEKMQRASIVSGKPSGFGYRFDPQGCATRAEVACIMCKFLDQLSYDEIWEPDINDASECIDYAESSFDDVEMEYTDEDGLVAYADVPKVLADCETTAKKMKEQGIVSKYNVNDDNITVWFTSGGAYMYTLNIKEMQEYAASPGVMVYEQRRGMTNDPERDKCFENKQKKYGYVTDLAKKIAQKDSGYPYVADYGGTKLTVDSAKEWNSNSIIIWVGHGGYDEDIGPCLITCQVRTDDNLQRFAKDYAAGRIIGKRDNYYALTWKFFDYYYKNNSLKGSLIWLAPCYSIRDSRLADTLLAKGASTVIGNKNPAFIPRIIYLTNEFFNTLMSTDLDTGATYTAGKALAKANDKLKANKVGDLVSPLIAKIDGHEEGPNNEVILKGDANWSLGGGAAVTGTVGDENGHPIKGAVVSIEGTNHTAVTASDGSYTLYGAGSMQTVTIKAEADGYYSETTSVSIGSTKGHASFVLKAIGKIKLSITADQDEDEISSVTCDVYKISGNKETMVQTKSFSTRSFTIDSLENGQQYKVKVVAKGYEWAYATTTAERSPTEIQVKLVKQNINLMPEISTAETEITVKDLDNRLLKNASVTLYGKKKDSSTFTKLTSGTTDSNGKLTIAKVDISYTTLKAEASLSGYISGSTEKSFAGQGKNKRYIEVTLDTEKSLEPDDPAQDNNSDSLPSEFDGYVRIRTAEDLSALKGDEKAVLVNDLSNAKAPFDWKGTLDGNGHTITSPQLWIMGSDTSWISSNYGIIRNLRFRNFSCSSGTGSKLGLVAENYGTIENCVILSGTLIGVCTYEPIKEGSIAGYNDKTGTITNCVNYASVSAKFEGDFKSAAYAGGICGFNSGTIRHCLNLGNVYAKSTRSLFIAGIAYSQAAFESNFDPIVSDCGNAGYVSGDIERLANRTYETEYWRMILSNRASDGYATDKGTVSYITEVSLSTLLSMWSDVLN